MTGERPSWLVPAVMLVCLAPVAAAAEQGGRYLAVLADGRRVEGAKLTGWHDGSPSPRLDSTSLSDPARPLRWLCDRSLPAFDVAGGAAEYVEFANGDRLVGRVIGPEPAAGEEGEQRPLRLRVRTPAPAGMPASLARDVVRVAEAEVRRIVWGRQGHAGPPAFQPGTLFDRDGRKTPFRRLRWDSDGLKLLLDDSVRFVPLADAVELHLPPTDPWETHFRQLAALCCDGSSPLIRIETTAGLVLTGSAGRFRATAVGDPKRADHWYRLLQPAWSDEPIWTPSAAIRTWWSFPPHELPLTWLAPAEVVQRSMVGFCWPWRLDRNVQGGELVAGGEPAGWGFGVNAHNELSFDLPALAVAFRTRVGLDAVVGPGGCARGMVYLDSTKVRPLYAGKVLVGSAAVLDTGEIRLPADGEKARRLILVADAAHDDRPEGADPFDIRDALDWIDPMLKLDPARLAAEVARRASSAVAAWQGWTTAVEGAAAPPVRSEWDANDPDGPRFVPVVATGGRRLVLTSVRRLPEEGGWLKLHARQIGRSVPAGRVEVRIDGQPVAQMPVPRAGLDRPYLVSLAGWAGRQVEVQVAYTPADAAERVDWRTLATVRRSTRANWVALQTLQAQSQNGAVLASQPDGSLLVVGQRKRIDRTVDTYVIRAATLLPHITAIRLEALADSSLPGGGPGRGGGNFVLTQFRMRTLPVERKAIRGRYVRIEMPRSKEALCLAEVQVFRPPPDEPALLAQLRQTPPPAELAVEGHKPADVLAILDTPPERRSLAQRVALRSYLDAVCQNLAPRGKASQSTTLAQFAPSLAIDGQVGVNFSHTLPQTPSPWWLLDLGAEQPIDRIVVWNRIDNTTVDWLKDFDVVVSDEKRQVTWQRQGIIDPPVPAVELFESDARDVAIKSAAESYAQAGYPAAAALGGRGAGWAVSPRFGESHAAVFTLERPLDARQTGLQIELKFAHEYALQTLGRFRLLATDDPLPVEAEPVGIAIDPLPARPPQVAAVPAPTTARAAAGPLPSPYPLFEDDGVFIAARPADQPGVALVSDDRHAGLRAVRIAPGGAYRLALADMIAIRDKPAVGEFRFVRFAFRKYGGGQVSLAPEHVSSKERPCRYEAGTGTPTDGNARSVWALELPAEWIVIDRDVFADFGRLDLTCLAIACRGGGPAVLDHIYVARSREDFAALPAAPSPEQTNQRAHDVLARPVLDKALPALVSLEIQGRHATGVLVGDDGYILTAGHLLAGAGAAAGAAAGNAQATVRLSDGRTVQAAAAGVDREQDVGLARIADKGPWKGLALGQAETFRPDRMYVGMSFSKSLDDGRKPVTYVAGITSDGKRTVWTDAGVKDVVGGGPLLDAAGRIVGVQVAVTSLGKLVFAKTHLLAEQWGSLTRGEVLGRWMGGTGPMMGIFSTQTKEGTRVDHVYPGTPAVEAGLAVGDVIMKVDGQDAAQYTEVGGALADKDPGAQVTVTVRRGQGTFQRKIRLIPRQDFPPPPKADRK